MLVTIIVILIHHAMLHFAFDKVQKSMSGLYYNHVDYSTVISMFFPLLLIAWPLTRGRGILTKFPLLVIILIFIAGIIFSYARAAVMGVAFAIIIAIAIRVRLVNLVMPAI